MPLPLPNLDDRRWADLVDEGRALIPRYAPVWTDHNVHDPGITLIELFAWLTENIIYRANRIPARHRGKFLALIGFAPRPPRAAQTVFTFTPDAGTSAFTLRQGVEFEAMDAEGKTIGFRILRELRVSAVKLTAVQVDVAEKGTAEDIVDRTRDWLDGLPIAVLGETPGQNAALYLGFDSLPSGEPVAIAFRFQGPGADVAERERILKEAEARLAACRRISPDITCEGAAEQSPLTEATLPPHHSARIVWEASTGADSWTQLLPVANAARPTPGQVWDDTRSLTLDGTVEVNLPPAIAPRVFGKVGTPLFYLRCRLAVGAYDASPLVIDIAPDSVAAEQAVPVWQRFTIAAGVAPSGILPTPGATTRLRMQLDAAGVIQALAFSPDNTALPEVFVLSYEKATGVAGQITLELALAGVSNGAPDQRVMLKQQVVQQESLRLFTHDGNAWQEWERRNDPDASRRTDSHFVLNATTGEIVFGDGERGRVPPRDVRILVAYRTTRAEKGNIAANSVISAANSPRNAVLLAGLPNTVRLQLLRIVTNRADAAGGAAAETLTAATGRAVETLHAHERLLEVCAETKCQTLDQVDRRRVLELRSPTRAVNLLDIERLALDVPGTRVVRARAWAAVHPSYPCLQAPGTVTVVVIPDLPTAKPEPSVGLLEAIKQYLDRRRVVCTRLEVAGPRYIVVRVVARVQTRFGAKTSRVKEQIRAALNTFLDPRRGGPEGKGWPFGRDVYRSEILQLIDGVPGVDHVLELSLSTDAGEPQCGNLPLCPTWLVVPGEHEINAV